MHCFFLWIRIPLPIGWRWIRAFYAKIPNRRIAIDFRCRVKENLCSSIFLYFFFWRGDGSFLEKYTWLYWISVDEHVSCEPIEKSSTAIGRYPRYPRYWFRKGFDFGVDSCYSKLRLLSGIQSHHIPVILNLTGIRPKGPFCIFYPNSVTS